MRLIAVLMSIACAGCGVALGAVIGPTETITQRQRKEPVRVSTTPVGAALTRTDGGKEVELGPSPKMDNASVSFTVTERSRSTAPYLGGALLEFVLGLSGAIAMNGEDGEGVALIAVFVPLAIMVDMIAALSVGLSDPKYSIEYGETSRYTARLPGYLPARKAYSPRESRELELLLEPEPTAPPPEEEPAEQAGEQQPPGDEALP